MADDSKGKSNSGKDPVTFPTTVLFADLVGSTDYAGAHNDNDYQEHLKLFKKTIREIFKKAEKYIKDRDFSVFHDVRGDEGLIATHPNSTDPKKELARIKGSILEILSVALSIKYEWLLLDENIERVSKERPPYEVAIGVNTGPVFWHDEKIEGYPINVAKRIEGESRKGSYSGVLIGESTYGYYVDTPGEDVIRFKQLESAPLKGVAGNLQVYEVIFVNLEEKYEEEEDKWYVLRLPELLYVEYTDSIKRKLMNIRKLLLNTHNAWYGNIFCNILWRRVAKLVNPTSKPTETDIEEAGKLLKNDILPVARKLIGFDPEEASWKIYYAQMCVDYLLYILPKQDSDRNSVAFVFDAMEILENLTAKEPYELDARLWLGRIYFELAKIPKNSVCFEDRIQYGCKEPKKFFEKALVQFKRVSVWEEKYQEAYFFMAVASFFLMNELKKCSDLAYTENDIQNLRAPVFENVENLFKIAKGIDKDYGEDSVSAWLKEFEKNEDCKEMKKIPKIAGILSKYKVQDVGK